MRDLLEDIFKQQGKWLRVYLSKDVINDPYEKTKDITCLHPIIIKAVIEDLTVTQAQWKMPGVKVSKVKDILIDSRFQKLIENAYLFEINGERYEGWKEFGKIQFREQPGINGKNYLRLYIYTKVG